eukprot:TRINITY_DN37890_c0_g1_i1.p1 TRINITY_DN37890_c0_g1~~TRINITY_DN37890_c0_g1_i1.p1  ORF type:complete len:265 (+),score=87.98 TRINITY_DN37890_c0_g1_i1:65-859(+)
MLPTGVHSAPVDFTADLKEGIRADLLHLCLTSEVDTVACDTAIRMFHAIAESDGCPEALGPYNEPALQANTGRFATFVAQMWLPRFIVDRAVFFHALVLLRRVLRAGCGKLDVTPANSMRLYSVAVAVSGKTIAVQPYGNEGWGVVTGLLATKRVFKHLEMEFLNLLDWNTHVANDEILHLIGELTAKMDHPIRRQIAVLAAVGDERAEAGAVAAGASRWAAFEEWRRGCAACRVLLGAALRKELPQDLGRELCFWVALPRRFM